MIGSILLVEDNPMDVDLTKRALQRHRLASELIEPLSGLPSRTQEVRQMEPRRNIIVARDGEEAVNMIPRWEEGEPAPTLILLDLKLPRLGGLEVLERLKHHPSFASIPVVVLTTSRDEGDVRRAYQLGANSYIVKPVDFDKFLEVAAQIEHYWTVLNEPPP
jgi:CheY-like chemotaxis protein